MRLRIQRATSQDVPVILDLIRGLAEYERLSHEVAATEHGLRETLFGSRPAAEVVVCYLGEEPAGFALFFHNYSTFLGRPGIYLEDLFVDEQHRGKGFGKALLVYLARLTKERNCGRLEWAVLDWNEPSINFYKSLGARSMDEWNVFRLTGETLDRVANVQVD